MKWSGQLNTETIDRVVREAGKETERSGAESESRLRFRLSLEEMLLNCREQCTEEAVFTLRMVRRGRCLAAELLLPEQYREDPGGPEDPLVRLRQEWKRGTGRRKNSWLYTVSTERSFSELIRFIWNYTRPYKRWLLFVVLAQALRAAIQVIVPLISARVIISITDKATEQILLTAVILLVVNVISDVNFIFCNLGYNSVYNKTLTLLEEDLAHHALRITIQSVDRKGSGPFIQRLTQDTAQLASSLSALVDVISQFVEKIGILVAILIMDRVAFAVVAAILVLQVVIENIRTIRMKRDDQLFRNANERYTGFVNEMVRGMKDMKLADSENAFESEMVKRIREANHRRLKMWNHSAVYNLVRLLIEYVGTFGFISVLVLLLVKGHIQPAEALVLFNYRSGIQLTTIQLIGAILQLIRETELSAERILAIIGGPEFPKETFGPRHLDRVEGEIRFEHVYFSYDRKYTRNPSGWVMKDMDFAIHAGETVALVGASGSGKSTILSLISKLYVASRGVVRIDGVDIRELDRESIRGHISVVTQNPYLFQMSIRDNLRLVKPDLTEEEMRDACRMASIDQDIMAKPEGYDSLIDENGVNFSGGQRQRLAIARALLKDSSVLILDEATSALDNVTQEKVRQAINAVGKSQKTVIIVAHRLSTVAGADRIFMIDQGRVLDQGTHQELLTRCAAYRRLYETETESDAEQVQGRSG